MRTANDKLQVSKVSVPVSDTAPIIDTFVYYFNNKLNLYNNLN